MALGCMLLGVGTVLTLRVVRKIHVSVVILVYGLITFTGGLLLCLIIGEFTFPQNGLHWIYGVSIAALTYISQWTLTLALKFEQAGPIALVRCSEIVFSFAWDFIFLGVHPDPFRYWE